MLESETTGRRRLLTSAVANWIGFAAQIGAAFFVSPVLVHGLGDRRYGIWSLVESVLAYLMLFDLGVAASVVRYVARFEATRDQDALNRVFSASVCIFAAAGAAVLMLTLVFAYPAFGLLNVPGDLAAEGRLMLVLLGLNLAVGLPMNVFACVLDGLGRYPAKSAIRTTGIVIRSILFIVVIRSGGGLLPVALAVTGYTLFEHLAMAVAVRRFLPGLRFSPRLVDRPTLRAIRGYSIDALMAMVAGRVSFQTDAVVINAFLQPQCITVFAVAGRLVEYAKDSLRVATTVLTPAVSALEARGDTAGIRNVFLDSTRYVLWLILPVQLGLLLLGRPFLFLWMGPEYAELSYPTLAILAAPLALSLSQSVSVRILYGTGRLRWFARLVMAEAAANLVLSVLLVRPYGVEGVALGTAIPNVVMNCVLAVYLCRALGVGAGEYLRRSFLVPCAAALIPCGLWLVIGSWSPPTTWLALLCTGVVGVAGYALLAAHREIGLRSVMARLRTPPESAPATVVTATVITTTADTKEPGCAFLPYAVESPLRGLRFRLSRRLPTRHPAEMWPGLESTTVNLRPFAGRFGNVKRYELLVLCAVARHLGARRLFEFGTFDGLTTWHLAANTETEARITTLDLPLDHPARFGTRHDRTVGKIQGVTVGQQFAGTVEASRIQQLFEDSLSFDAEPYRGQFDFCFIDASHEYEHVCRDTVNALEMVRPGGAIFWHDYSRWWPGVQKCLDEHARELPLFRVAETALAALIRP